MSRITWLRSLTKTLTDPLVPAGTMAAFALIRPSVEFRVDTVGCACPVGHKVSQLSGPCGTTVTFSAYAFAVAGMPQAAPEISNSRTSFSARIGPPLLPFAWRVSAIRQGSTGKKRTGVFPLDEGGPGFPCSSGSFPAVPSDVDLESLAFACPVSNRPARQRASTNGLIPAETNIAINSPVSTKHRVENQ